MGYLGFNFVDINKFMRSALDENPVPAVSQLNNKKKSIYLNVSRLRRLLGRFSVSFCDFFLRACIA